MGKYQRRFFIKRAVYAGVVVGVLCAAGFWGASGPSLTVSTERINGVYHLGETARFHIRLQPSRDEPAVTADYRLTVSHSRTVGSGTALLRRGRAVVEHTLDRVGTTILSVTVHGKKKRQAEWGVAVNPFAITPVQKAPADFRDFWRRRKAVIRHHPAKPTLIPVSYRRRRGPRLVCYDLTIAVPSYRPVHAYFAKPRGKRRGLPAVVRLHPAGIRGSRKSAAVNEAARGALAVDMNAHGLPNGRGDGYYRRLRNGPMSRYAHEGLERPDSYHLMGMYLRLLRVIDFLCQRPEWDGENLTLKGSSQGGGQAIVGAGLDSRVSRIVAAVPSFCGLVDAAGGRRSGFPGVTPRSPAEWRTLRYFDAVNFAPYVRAEAEFTVGLLDRVCPAEGIFAAYNRIPGKRSIIIIPARRHGYTKAALKAERDPLYRHHHSGRTRTRKEDAAK